HFGLPLYVLSAYLVWSALTETYAGWWLQKRLSTLQFILFHWPIHARLGRYFKMVRPKDRPGPAWQPCRGDWRAIVAIGAGSGMGLVAAVALHAWPLAGLVLLVAGALVLVGPAPSILIIGGGLTLVLVTLDCLPLALLVALIALTLLLLAD